MNIGSRTGVLVTLVEDFEVRRLEFVPDHVDQLHGLLVGRPRLRGVDQSLDRLGEVLVALSGDDVNDLGFRLVASRLRQRHRIADADGLAVEYDLLLRRVVSGQLIVKQDRHGLAEIGRRLSDRHEILTFRIVVLGDADRVARQIGGGYRNDWLKLFRELIEIEPVEGVIDERGAHHQRVTEFRRPMRQIDRPEIAGVDLLSGDLRQSVDAVASLSRRPAPSAWRAHRGGAGWCPSAEIESGYEETCSTGCRCRLQEFAPG